MVHCLLVVFGCCRISCEFLFGVVLCVRGCFVGLLVVVFGCCLYVLV